jgi:hypothetical protein
MIQSIAGGQPQVAMGEVSTTVPPLAHSVRRRRQQRDMRLYASAMLAIVSIILLIILAIVFTRGGESSESPAREAPTQEMPAKATDPI